MPDSGISTDEEVRMMSASIYTVPGATPVAGSAMGKAPDDYLAPLLGQLDSVLSMSGYLHAEVSLLERSIGVLAPDVVSTGAKDAAAAPSASDFAAMVAQNLSLLLLRLQAVNTRISGDSAPRVVGQGPQG